jgi:hypothetical protein
VQQETMMSPVIPGKMTFLSSFVSPSPVPVPRSQ